MIAQIVFSLIGGLALFLYGISLISKGFQKVAGERTSKILETFTGSPLRGIMVGAGITAIIQSSSITTVTLVGLVNAGVLTLQQSVGVIMGANIGTTVTAQIVAFKVGMYALPIIAIGCLLWFMPQDKYQSPGQILIGFGILFLGMNFMSGGAKPLRELPFFVNMLVNFGKQPILGVFAAALFTAVIQSSSATIGLVIALSMQGLLNLTSAICLIFGADIGTCVTALLASIGTSISAKRTAVAHILFNVLGVLIFLFILPLFVQVVSRTSTYLPRQIANAQVLFNVGNALIVLPFISFLVAMVKRIVPGEEVVIDRGIKYIEKHILVMPSVALTQATKETIRLAEMVAKMLHDCQRIFLNSNRNNRELIKTLIKTLVKMEEASDGIYLAISDYLVKLSQKPLTKDQSRKLAGLNHVITEIERIADHVNNIAQLAEHKINRNLPFSAKAMDQLQYMFSKVNEVYDDVVVALKNEDSEIAYKVIQGESEIDDIEKKLHADHIKRIEDGICLPEAGILFVDIVRNLERTGDHTDSIAHVILAEF
ncbi:MAG: Na/Pi cotransporter family protein [Actinomycetota bacterium]|nr:Na/Pi cotransporter family protein [Actinomycetota bacterium]